MDWLTGTTVHSSTVQTLGTPDASTGREPLGLHRKVPMMFRRPRPATPAPMPTVLSWQAAEYLAAEAMRAMGFEHVQVTQASRDGGVDVIAHGAVAQVKLLSSAVQRPDVQRLRGAAFRVQHALFFSWSGYTAGAVDYADQNGVALFTVVGAAPMATNAVARSLLADQSTRIMRLHQHTHTTGTDAARRGGAMRGAARTLRTGARWAQEHWRVSVPIGSGLLASSVFYGIVEANEGPWPNDEPPNWVVMVGIALWTVVGLATHAIIRWRCPATTDQEMGSPRTTTITPPTQPVD